MTTRFVSAAKMMSGVLGAPDFPFVTIEHPISSATHDALAEQAKIAAQESMRLLVAA